VFSAFAVVQIIVGDDSEPWAACSAPASVGRWVGIDAAIIIVIRAAGNLRQHDGRREERGHRDCKTN